MLQTCDCGWRRHLLRARTFITHAHAFKGTAPSLMRMSKSGRISDETSGSGSHRSSANPTNSNALKLRNASTNLQSNQYSKHLGGMGMASLGDDGVDDDRGGGCCCMYDRA